jgi:hypothetical protein
VQEKGTRDNAANKSYGNSISMVLGCGQKPSGEEVSVSLRLRSRATDRPDNVAASKEANADSRRVKAANLPLPP